MSSVHLLVLIHGMWGNPGHLSELCRIITETYPTPLDDIKLEVLLAETNRDNSTYDGIDWGGERVAEEVVAKMDELKKDGKTVSRFSVTGYSLGGLIARYVVGILSQRGFFDQVTPVNFNTIATPHIGLPKYPSFISTLTSSLGSKLLSRTGEQFYLVDKWSVTGRPLIEVMADPKQIFHQALSQFRQIRIYANAVYDTTVPYVTSAIEIDDPFALFKTNGIQMQVKLLTELSRASHLVFYSDLDDKYFPLIKTFDLPEIPPAPTPKPVILSQDWFRDQKAGRPFLPTTLQVLYFLLPILMPVALSLAVINFSFQSCASRARIRLLEEDSKGQKLINILAQLEVELKDTVVNLMVDHPAESQPASYLPGQKQSPRPIPNDPIFVDTISSIEEGAGIPNSPAATLSGPSSSSKPAPEQPILSPLQHKIVGWLNQLPLRKDLAYFPDVRNSHGMIVCRDAHRFKVHRRGEGIVRHWAASFIL
ncbi:hypothetical protein H0H81_003599 [Sphagnurus paluster]|uniref:DUF676 domain-containing protein n=1 Tax=Sphagnurus paluster TaxID=117069 RepID=A0A9P7FWP0_9AGAR|nr:hypothetical protein H0H81_003599 [Sphagnurus paluster]